MVGTVVCVIVSVIVVSILIFRVAIVRVVVISVVVSVVLVSCAVVDPLLKFLARFMSEEDKALIEIRVILRRRNVDGESCLEGVVVWVHCRIANRTI